MKILPAFSLFQPSAFPNAIPPLQVGNAVGFVFDVAAFPIQVQVDSDFGSAFVKRRQIVRLKTSAKYQFSVDDTFAGDVESDTFARIDDYWNDYPRNLFSAKANGVIPITVFESESEMEAYKLADTPAPIYLAPSCNDVKDAAERWILQNIDFDCVDTFVAQKSGTNHFANFYVYTGKDGVTANGVLPVDVKNRTILGAMGYTELTNYFNSGNLTIQNVPNLGLQVRATDATATNQRFYWLMRFYSRKMSTQVAGLSVIFGKMTLVGTTAQTLYLAMPLFQFVGVQICRLFNVGAGNITTVYWKRLGIAPEGTAIESTAIVASAALTAGSQSVGGGVNPEANHVIVATPASDCTLWYVASQAH